MTDDEFDKFLAGALTPRKLPSDEAAAARVLQRLAGPLPRQHRALWRLPTVLLDWQFAPAWPRMAALAACLAFGFAIGLSGVDRGFEYGVGARNADSGALVFEPQSLTGDRP